MTNLTVEDIQQIVRLQLGVRQVEQSNNLIEELGAESADIANIVAALESKSGIRISESELVRIQTIADLVKLFNRDV